MDFVLALHTHLPYVLNHGRWPHGSDWLCEAVVDTYLPLLEALSALEREGTPTPVTLGITPVLANQLASPDLVHELSAFLTQRIEASREAARDLAGTHDNALVPIAHFWEDRLRRLAKHYDAIGGDIVGAFRGLAERGRLELISSAATHGFLPLLASDESIALQLDVGRREHRRLFGVEPAGLWLPECAYRPAGPWRPFAHDSAGEHRVGIETHVQRAGYRYFFTDAHMARAGAPLGVYGVPGEHGWPEHVVQQWTPGDARNSPYRGYRVSHDEGGETPVAALVRDPRSSAQVWSRHGGYPGEQWYLEFHKTRWPGGLKFWRVSAAGSDLGSKAVYAPGPAHSQAVLHGRHFAKLLHDVAARERARSPEHDVIVAPFDTELFGHWWFEGPEFLTSVWRTLAGDSAVRPVTASTHFERHPARTGLTLAAGSWGKNGDWSMWNGPAVAGTWPALWRMEREFWDLAPAAIRSEVARPVLAQAARSMLLAQASDWQFIISTGEADDYAVKRFREHCADFAGLSSGLRSGLSGGDWSGVRGFAEALAARDRLFPAVLDSVQAVLDRRG